MVVENTFERLKGRWRCLLKRNDSHVSNVLSIVSACVVLHNICEMFSVLKVLHAFNGLSVNGALISVTKRMYMHSMTDP